MYHACIVISTSNPTWAPEAFAALVPGSYLIVFGTEPYFEVAALEARVAGFVLRDTFSIYSYGPRLRIAYLFRKPIEEPTVTNQVLKTGTGALNIDECRVAADMSEFFSGTGKPRSGMGHAHGYGMGEGFGGDSANPPHSSGRWPPNLLFVHDTELCILEGTKKVPGHKGYPNGPGGKSYQYSSDKRWQEVRPNAWAGHADAEGMESVPSWKCGERCPARLLDLQSGTLKSGGVSRFFPQFQTEANLIDWFTRLILIPNGNILTLS